MSSFLAKIYFEALVPSIPSWMFVVALVAFMTAFNLRSLKSVANFNTVIVVYFGYSSSFLLSLVFSPHHLLSFGSRGFDVLRGPAVCSLRYSPSPF